MAVPVPVPTQFTVSGSRGAHLMRFLFKNSFTALCVYPYLYPSQPPALSLCLALSVCILCCCQRSRLRSPPPSLCGYQLSVHWTHFARTLAQRKVCLCRQRRRRRRRRLIKVLPMASMPPSPALPTSCHLFAEANAKRQTLPSVSSSTALVLLPSFAIFRHTHVEL